MNRRAVELVRRQQSLLVRSSELRGDFSRQADALRQPFALADQVLACWRWLRAHPEVPLVGLAVLALLRPRRAWRWGWRLWSCWRLYVRWFPRAYKKAEWLGWARRG